MFEKEAEELFKKKPLGYEMKPELEIYTDGFKDGYNKANEWHYVKDGLPKTSGRYLVYTGGEPFILYFDAEVNSFGYWVVSLGDNWGVRDEDFETVKDRGEDEVIAWKEIVPPEVNQ